MSDVKLEISGKAFATILAGLRCLAACGRDSEPSAACKFRQVEDVITDAGIYPVPTPDQIDQLAEFLNLDGADTE